MKQFYISVSLLLLGLTSLISACNKTIEPIEEFTDFQIQFNEQYLPAALVDSAIVNWEVNGTTQRLKMEREGILNRFTVPLAYMRNGSGKMTVQLYTQKKMGNSPLLWEQQFDYTLNKKKFLAKPGPAGINDQTWHPRVMFNYDNAMGSRFTAIVAVHPFDSYFELKGVAPVYARKIEIVRSFFQKETSTEVYSKNWICDASCLDNGGNLINKLHFLNLGQQLEGRQWNQYRISTHFQVNSNQNETYSFEVTEDR